MQLIDKIAEWENLQKAFNKAKKGKTSKEEVLEFASDLWKHLGNLQLHLLNDSYKMGAYRQFVVYEPQKRDILAAPFKDRVAQHALLNILEEQWDRHLIEDTYACRKGKGTHAAADRIQFWLKNMVKNQPLDTIWIVKTDYEKFFASLQHWLLKQVAAQGIKCQRTIKVIFAVIDSILDPGQPIGNLLSQWLANLVGNVIDQFVKRKLQVKRYLRYMDDCVAIFGTKAEAQFYLEQLKIISAELGLKFSSISLHKATQGVNMVGYRIWPTHRLIRKRAIVKFRRDIKRIKRTITCPNERKKAIMKRFQSFEAHAKHANTYRLRQKLKAEAFNSAI